MKEPAYGLLPVLNMRTGRQLRGHLSCAAMVFVSPHFTADPRNVFSPH
jgi:hypothetical protein